MISFRIKPYIQEATLQVVLDVIIIAIVLTVLIVANFSPLVCISVVIGYLVIVLTFHYKIVIQAIIDNRKKDYITEIIQVKKFSKEYSFSGDRLGHSNIHFFYPKDIQVSKYKIKVICNDGAAKELRSVMSFRRLLKFAVLDKQKIEYLQVTYLKRSKILIHINYAGDVDKIPSKRGKNIIEKSIHFINMSV